jgi:hypothetical protein
MSEYFTGCNALLCIESRGTMNPNQSAIRGFPSPGNHMQSIRGIQFGVGSLENEVVRH